MGVYIIPAGSKPPGMRARPRAASQPNRLRKDGTRPEGEDQLRARVGPGQVAYPGSRTRLRQSELRNDRSADRTL